MQIHYSYTLGTSDYFINDLSTLVRSQCRGCLVVLGELHHHDCPVLQKEIQLLEARLAQLKAQLDSPPKQELPLNQYINYDTQEVERCE